MHYYALSIAMRMFFYFLVSPSILSYNISNIGCRFNAIIIIYIMGLYLKFAFNIRRVQQSADELRYLKSLLQAQYKMLNASRNELHNITSNDILYTLDKINASLLYLDEKVNNAIDKLMQFQIECFTQVNATACKIITTGENVFKFIIDKMAEHYEQAAYLESVLQSRNLSIIMLDEKLIGIERQINALISMIDLAERDNIERNADLTSRENFAAKSCPTAWEKTLFTYESDKTILDDVICSGKVTVDIGNDTMVPYCPDERIPINSSKRLLWNLASCSVDNHAKGFGRYNDFVSLMNTAKSKISATLTKVDIQRAWFDEAIFRNWEYFSFVSINAN